MKTYLTLLTFIFSIQIFFAQNKVLVLDTSNSGIPSNFVASILFDSNNNLWIGTNDKGIGMFDGSNWTYYNKSNTSALQSNYINDIKQHPNGDMWFGTGLGIAVLSSGSWTFYDTSIINFYDIPFPYSVDKFQPYVQFDSNGDAYTIGRENHPYTTINVYKYENNNWSLIHQDSSNLFGGYLPPKYFVIDKNDHLWIRSGHKFDGNSWSLVPLPNPKLNISFDKAGIAIDDNDDVWYFLVDGNKSATQTVYRFDGTKLHDMYETTVRLAAGPAMLKFNPYNGSMYCASTAFATRVAWYDGVSWKTDTVLDYALIASSLDGIKAMEFDFRGNVWIGLNNSTEFYKQTPDLGGIIIYNENGVNLTNFPVGTNNNTKDIGHFLIYPNPSNGIIAIASDDLISTIQLFDISGRLVLEKRVDNKNAQLDLMAFQKGTYQLLLLGENESVLHTKRLVLHGTR